mmetsp:Transcript_10719/g.20558  ORF Transcript_10719/g.20558 Transcript_10719/m.20558 type:complete len:369 (-) Transcript_10719:139-1245(-)|eukprot:CAMPEP_0170178192 /NCGR_PEP_ID=MMETSP0040_2-20121228/11726_1 /TAXON_ID=641309 /ORGANISM="Lotharella oceanica, Strain CCMP622" /LENGTH=368 /DNA_ID=CAMNT_0010421185 /DNA_START=31 /DNA_END=1137 /DNA_ORIENTATION=+
MPPAAAVNTDGAQRSKPPDNSSKVEKRPQKKTKKPIFSVGDAVFMAGCSAMLGVACKVDLENWIPGLQEMEESMRLTKGISDKAMYNAWPIFMICTVAYVCLLTLGIRYMKDREPLPWAKRVLPVWMLLIWAFSFLAMTRIGTATFKYAAEIMRRNDNIFAGVSDFAYNYCVESEGGFMYLLRPLPENDYHAGKMSWVHLFCYSKLFEFIDTAFLVITKKPVSRLHYIHHLITSWYSWLNLVHFAAPGQFFALLNAFVHSTMYLWYFLATIKMKPGFYAIFVTALQNIQMLLAVGVTIYFYANRLHCNIPTHYWIITMSMYLFYVYLFGNLFWERYLQKPCKNQCNGPKGKGGELNNVNSNVTASTAG